MNRRVFRKRLFVCLISTALVGVGLMGTVSLADAETTGSNVAEAFPSKDEYLAGFARYQACLETHGHRVILLESINEVLDYRIPGEAVDDGSEEFCYLSEFMTIDLGWQARTQDLRDDNQILEQCLQQHGLPVPDGRTEKIVVLENSEIDLASCFG